MQCFSVCESGHAGHDPHRSLEGGKLKSWLDDHDITAVRRVGEGHWLIDSFDRLHLFPRWDPIPGTRTLKDLGVEPSSIKRYLETCIRQAENNSGGSSAAPISITHEAALLLWNAGLLEPMHLEAATESRVEFRTVNGRPRKRGRLVGGRGSWNCRATISTEINLCGERRLQIVPGQFAPLMLVSETPRVTEPIRA